jgi:hypothetical protein
VIAQGEHRSAHPRTGIPHAASSGAWDKRSFVATGALLSGSALPLTGLLDHLAGGPSAEAAVGWSIVHTSLGALFAAFCVWHVLLNRKALLRYLRASAAGHVMRGRAAPSREMLAAMALVGGVLAATVLHALVGG